ncbi:TIGR02679 family protein [Halobacillus sp. BBL2006]|uniref:TIGR02679 family protein n=1 Tax=Halobacillus sp. BBL2006 TaxID=1543706 RepID=UPI000543D054|nr:TIGR02679 family protein [Halobacillus sp. BBL2006]KHE67441.1 hypothetical protein LD39_17520 [Halobacillus sp. BBL2006]
MDKREEAVAFFRSEPFHRLFDDFRNKYQSLGRIGGSVSIKEYTESEVEAIAGFLGKSPEEVWSSRVSLSAFEKRLLDTKFEGLSLVEILEQYFGETLVSNAKQAAEKERRLENFFQTIEVEYPALSFWVKILREKPPSTYSFFPWMKEEKSFLALMEQLDHAFRTRPSPGQFERLPKFSQRITQDPHAFDGSRPLGKLWIHLLSMDQETAVPKTSEGVTELLEAYGLLRDDLMNFVTCANLLADDGGGVHPVWREAYKIQLVRNITLRELMTLERVYVPDSERVFVVENSGVCSMLLDEVTSVPLVSTQGQVKLATWKLFDYLVAEGVTLYYSGDFDPEGLKMADLMKKRYPDQVVLWRMSVRDYEASAPEVEISESRLKKLDSIESPELNEVILAMRRTGKAGYQEALVGVMIKDMQG